MSTILYTDVGRVVRALAFQSPELVAGNGNLTVGTTQITVNQTLPADWQVGTSLGIDANNSTTFEVVTITSIPSASVINVTPLTQVHTNGVPIINVTAVVPYVSAASRWFDSVTYNSTGLAYEAMTDKKMAYIDIDGYIVIPLTKPLVKIENVTSVTFQPTPLDPVDTLNVTQAWIEDDYFLKIASINFYYRRNGHAVIAYSGGFNPIPDDIVQAVTVMAARMYKERDSGYSDVIGSAETGIMQYKKAAPADVQVIINKYRRWTE